MKKPDRLVCQVFGPHASGNNLNARIVRSAGFTEEGVWAWSVPGDTTLAGNGISTQFYIVSHRDPTYTAKAMVAKHGAKDMAEALRWVHDARWFTVEFRAQRPDDIFIDVNYEDTVAFGALFTIDLIAKRMGWTRWLFDEEIVDGNAKYQGAEML